MQMNITFRHIDPIDSLKNYAREKVERGNKYLDRATEATVVLSLERHLHHADIRIQSGTYLLRGREKSEDMYASIDLAMDKIERQLKRYKEKLKSHHGKEQVHHRHELVERLKIRHQIFEGGVEIPEQARTVVTTSEFTMRPMSLEEAILEMEGSRNRFVIYRDANSENISVIYRRDDGNFALLEANS